MYAERFNLNNPDSVLIKRLVNKKPLIFTNLESYFNELALYSNNNFYSKDTIGAQSGYEQPNSMDRRFDKGFWFRFYDDLEFGEYRLIQEIIPGRFNYIISNQSNFSLIDPNNLVMIDYWSRLSTKSVQYGAGVVNLFFQEVEKAKQDPDFIKTGEKSLLGKAVDSTKSFFAQVGSTVSGIFRKDDGFKPAGQISLSQSQAVQLTGQAKTDETQKTEPLSASTQTSNQTPSQTSSQIQKPDSSKNIRRTSAEEEKNLPFQQPEIQRITTSTLQQTTSTQQQITKPTTIFKECSFNTSQSPSRQKVIINEIAWMGGSGDFGLTATDEWIELKNISNAEIDVSNWQLIDKTEQIKINLGLMNKIKIPASGFILLERTDDDSAPNVAADLIYSNTLNNSDEGLRLFDNQCNLIDEVLANPNWPAGDNTQKRTMERSSNLSWHTYNGTAQNSIFGTPKKENSAPTIYSSDGNGGSNASTNNQQQTTADNSTSSPAKILINEIQITGGTNKTKNDFIELYNPNNFQVNLNGYRLVKRTQAGTGDDLIKSWTTDIFISANGYYLWANNDYADIPVTPNIATTDIISDNNGIAIRFGAANTGTIIDSVAWGEAQNNFIETTVFSTNPTANQSIQRKFQNNTFIDTDNNAQDFEIQSCPSPKAPSGNCQSATNQAPSAFFVYTPLNPQVGNLITFNAASSTDYDGIISAYQWDFGDPSASSEQATSSVSTATTTHSYLTAGTYTASLIVFDNQNASSTATSTIISVNTSGINHLVISEIMADAGASRSDDEFIELYNPTNGAISLNGYSIQYLSGTATSTANIQKKNFSSNAQIAPKSFFLLVNNNATSSLLSKKDMDYSFGLSGNQSGATIFLVNATISISGANDLVIIDGLSYGNPQLAVSAATSTVPNSNKSLERKAWQNGQCLSSQLDGEFLGNGCDTNNASDFEIRNSPNPQNFQGLPELRSQPTKPENFTVKYSSSTMELNFNWDALQASSTLTYKITDISNTSSTLPTIETASTTATTSISEFGRSYKFSIVAIDKESYGSGKSEASVNIPPNLTVIAQQLDKSVFERGTGNGQFYQLLGSGLTGEPKEVSFRAKFLASGYWKQTYHINITFWQSDKSDYSNLVKVSSNTCTRDNPGADTYDKNNIYGSDCPNLNFEFGVEKDYTVPIQEPFIFNPAKYYKMILFIYQSEGYFYGSTDENSYVYGRSTRDNGGGTEVDSSPVKDLYFIIPAKSAFEIPLQTSQLTPQNFALSYSSSAYEINFNWNKPRYLENSTSTLTYRITDISATSSTLPNIETTATSTKISINEVGRNYKFSIQAFDENGCFFNR